jgi:hypothetical protein
MYLLNKNDEELLEFEVDLGRLSFLGKELRTVSIYHYPIIIFEFMTGYYTTKEIFEKNTQISIGFMNDFEIMERPRDLSKSLMPSNTLLQHKSANIDYKENKLVTQSVLIPKKEQANENSNQNQVDLSSEAKPSKKKVEFKLSPPKNNLDNENINRKSELNSNKTMIGSSSSKRNPVVHKRGAGGQEKKQEKSQIQTQKFNDYFRPFQMLTYFINPENTNESNIDLGKEIDEFKEGFEQYKRKLRIIEMEKKIAFLKKKNEAIEELKKELEEIIKNKNQNLQKVTEQLKPKQINYSNKLKQLKNNLNGRGQYQLIYDSFVYQKMAEVCFVFFNNKIQSLYIIPEDYNIPITSFKQVNIQNMQKFYNNEKKSISAMMGHIGQLLIYLSKTFNIPLRYPIFLNGSKSYILRSVKDKVFLPLYIDAKKEDKHGNFDNALNCLKDDIKEIFNFLSMFPEIISKEDNEHVNNMNGKYLFYFFFVMFNHSLFKFMKLLQNDI